MTTVGVLAVQGAVQAHRRLLDRLGVTSTELRTPDQLDDVDAVILPGGESTTISLLLERSGLLEPFAGRLAQGMPAFGTCAGMILLASSVLDGRDDQHVLAAIDLTVRRNAFGRQVSSFETDLPIVALEGGRFPAVFIRAPGVEAVGPDVEVLATVDEVPVACAQGPVLVTAFHPELTDDTRLHACWLERIDASGTGAAGGAR